TRLNILSFERLAEFALRALHQPLPECLSEEGRLMVLRALLVRHQNDLQVFRATARLDGFAQQLSARLRECQRHHLTPERLDELARSDQLNPTLRAKLHDLALMARAYAQWLRAEGLRDVEALLDTAADALRAAPHSLQIAGLWLDGFAELTAQELELLAALLSHCQRATLAFCLPAHAGADTSWRSPWLLVAETYRRCRARLEAVPGVMISVEPIQPEATRNRFVAAPALGQLEACLAAPTPNPAPIADAAETIRLVRCHDAEAEAVLAAREILRFVRERGARFRDCAVLVRQLEAYHAAVSRVFRRYGIPFFVDRREPVAHHPLAELTRFAMRVAAFGWQHEDWFGALKTGLTGTSEDALDRLENAALEHGWNGAAWRKACFGQPDSPVAEAFEKLRARLVPPFEKFADALASQPGSGISGAALAEAIQNLWVELDVETTLLRWADTVAERFAVANVQAEVHATVLEQMRRWLENLALAFDQQTLSPAGWLPILEAGLASLTVGVIPPALDQVLVGAVDRSRNPDLKLAIVLGFNEAVFPRRPAPGPLLTAAECAELEQRGVRVGLSQNEQLSRERYLAYIACTRATERLVVTCAELDATGQPGNPSLFFDQLQQLVGREPEAFAGSTSWRQAEHACELVGPLAAARLEEPGALITPADAAALRQLAVLPVFESLLAKAVAVERALAAKTLCPETAERLYGRELESSVGALEDFAACPFRFFAARGLRLEERKEFQFDDRDLGSFQHDVLREFHRRVRAQGRHWRHLNAAEAQVIIGNIAQEMLPGFERGKLEASAGARFAAEVAVARLERLIGVLVEWMAHYEFDPLAAELSFGLEKEGLPAWRVELPGGRALVLRGRMDRVDAHFQEDEAWVVVMDYKSSARELDPTKLHHGLELQLLAYLRVLERLDVLARKLEVQRVVPVGAFYVPLNGDANLGHRPRTRDEVLAADPAQRRLVYQHTGRFCADALPLLDNRNAQQGEQFRYRRNKDGALAATVRDALSSGEFTALLDRIEHFIGDFAQRIFDGDVEVAPYRTSRETACDFCAFRAVCRFDPWTDEYRVLQPPRKATRPAEAAAAPADAPPARKTRSRKAP
ncbi:MAG: PD-(D/E)XK nuclease family protein, partial [Verrucomicrobiales bacterium]|nr:PD-(D/E)XK nuclease family protein [Verrucomicrobiales bacterium]